MKIHFTPRMGYSWFEPRHPANRPFLVFSRYLLDLRRQQVLYPVNSFDKFEIIHDSTNVQSSAISVQAWNSEKTDSLPIPLNPHAPNAQAIAPSSNSDTSDQLRNIARAALNSDCGAIYEPPRAPRFNTSSTNTNKRQDFNKRSFIARNKNPIVSDSVESATRTSLNPNSVPIHLEEYEIYPRSRLHYDNGAASKHTTIGFENANRGKGKRQNQAAESNYY